MLNSNFFSDTLQWAVYQVYIWSRHGYNLAQLHLEQIQTIVRPNLPAMPKISSESTHCLVRATVIGRIDYCNSLLFKIPAVHIAKLQRIQPE